MSVATSCIQNPRDHHFLDVTLLSGVRRVPHPADARAGTRFEAVLPVASRSVVEMPQMPLRAGLRQLTG